MATTSNIPVVMAFFMVLAPCQGCDTQSDPTCYLYPLYQQMEAALVNDSQNLHMLRQVFFLPDRANHPTIRIHACIAAEETVVKYCSTSSKEQPVFRRHDANGTGHSQECWKFQWSSSALLASITADELLVFDNTLFVLFYSMLGPIAGRDVTLNLQLGVLSCTPSKEEVSRVWTTLLSWIKAYTRAHKKPETWSEEDKGFVSVHDNFWVIKGDGGNPEDPHYHSHSIRFLLLAAFIFINLLILFLLMKFAPEYYTNLKIRINHFGETYSIFWASIIMITIFNTTNLIVMISGYVITEHPLISQCVTNSSAHICEFYHKNGMYADMMSAFLAKLIIFPCALVIELLTAACIHKDLAFPIPTLSQKLMCCCCCLFCSSQTQSKAIQTFVLWNIMVFLQNMALSVLPTAIMLIASPLIIIPILTVILSFFITCVIAIAHLIPPKHTAKKACTSTLLQFTCTMLFFGMVTTLSLFYAAMVTNGATSTGLSNFLFQLLPSILLSALGYYMKQKFLNRRPEDIPTHYHSTDILPMTHYHEECTKLT